MTAAFSTDLADHVATETTWRAELSLQTGSATLHATLIREETRWYDDDPTADVTEEVVCERDLAVPLPAAFAAVDEWLVAQHRLRVLPHSWVPCDSGGDTGVALLLEGRALPAHPIGFLSNWGA